MCAGQTDPVDAAARVGYDAWHHGVSQLTLGELGWLERVAFLLGFSWITLLAMR